MRYYLSPLIFLIFSSSAFALDMLADLRVPIRDNISLSGYAWMPDKTKANPTILVLTPYLADHAFPTAEKLIAGGYNFVVLDVRGRGSSGGEFTALEGHGIEGCDAIDWIVKQDWATDQVVMWGGSYVGMTQWQVAAKCPEKLAAIAPTASVYPGHDFPSIQGQWSYYYAIQWLTFTSGRGSHPKMFGGGEGEFWTKKFHSFIRSGRPFHELDDFVGMPNKTFDLWVQQLGKPTEKTIWADDNPTAKELANIDIPVMTITGHYDADQAGALRYYQEHVAQNGNDKHFLVMGPWDHGQTRRPKDSVGGFKTSNAAVWDMEQLHIDFYNWALGKGELPEELDAPVKVYEMVTDEWFSAPSLEAVSNEYMTLFLEPSYAPKNNVFNGGYLSKKQNRKGQTKIISDPRNFTNLTLLENSSGNENWVTGVRTTHLNEAVVFNSSPFEESVNIAGQPLLSVFLKIDTPDTHLDAQIFRIGADGSSQVIGYGGMRARFREGIDNSKAVEPDSILEYEFINFYWSSFKVKKDERIRLVISPSMSTWAVVNKNVDGRIGFEETDDARVANIEIYHSEQYPSRLQLPLRKVEILEGKK